MNLGTVIGYVLCTFVFEVHAKIWHILLVHVLLLILALFISLSFLQNQPTIDSLSMNLWTKIKHPFIDIKHLIIDLKHNYLLLSFSTLLLSLFFYEIFRMGSSSIYYLYFHQMSFNDTQYAAYFTCEQLAMCFSLIFLALLRKKWQINELYLCIIGLCLSLIGPFLFAFAGYNKAMIFGGTKFKEEKKIVRIRFFVCSIAIPSMMFGTYFPVCLRAIIARLVPEGDKGM